MTKTERAFFVTGGSLQADARCYVERNADAELYHALHAGEFCYVLNARQMGKSSLMVRTAAKLRHDGVRVILLDLTAIGRNVTAEQWYYGLVDLTGEQLGLEQRLETLWAEHSQLGPLRRFMKVLRVLLSQDLADDRVVVFIDEIDVVRGLTFPTDELFAAIRECYNQRSRDEALHRLTFCLLGVATPSDLIQDKGLTPFNVGRRIELDDFSNEEAQALLAGLQFSTQASERLKEILTWTSGHPYLTQRLCLASAEHPDRSVDQLVRDLFLAPRAREKDDNLIFVGDRILRADTDLASLLDLYRRIRSGDKVEDDVTNSFIATLRLSGVVRSVDGQLRVRNRIYGQAFDLSWVRDHMPGAEAKRQRAAYMRGLLRAFAIGSVVVASLVVLAVRAARSETKAMGALALEIRARDQVERLLYDADMMLAQEAWDGPTCQVGPVYNLLDRTRNSPNRGFEWAYWWRQAHVGQIVINEDQALVYVDACADGRRFVTLNGDHVIQVRDASDGHCLKSFRAGTSMDNMAVSGDGSRILTVQDGAPPALWDGMTGRELMLLRGLRNPADCVAISPDGRRGVTGGGDRDLHGEARIWDLVSGQQIGVLINGGYWVTAVALSPDTRQVATGDNQGHVKVWDANSHRLIRSLEGHTTTVLSIVYSPDGRRIVTAGNDHSARVWDVATGRQIVRLLGHTGSVLATFFPDGSKVVTGSGDNTAILWDASTGQALARLCGHTNSILGVAVAGGRIVTCSTDRTVRLWDAWNLPAPRVLLGHTKPILGVKFSPDGSRLATCGWDGAIRLWDANNGNLIFAVARTGAAYDDLAFNPDGRSIAYAENSRNGSIVRLIDANSGVTLGAIGSKAERRIRCLAYSPDGSVIASGEDLGTVQERDTRTGRTIRNLAAQGTTISGVAFSPDGAKIAGSSWDSNVYVWDARTGSRLLTLHGHSMAVGSIAFSPNGRSILSGGADGFARVWSAETGIEIMALPTLAHGGTAAYMPDGRIVVGSSDGSVRLWDSDTGRELLQLRGLTRPIAEVAISRDGLRIAAGGFDATARIWRAASPSEIAVHGAPRN